MRSSALDRVCIEVLLLCGWTGCLIATGFRASLIMTEACCT